MAISMGIQKQYSYNECSGRISLTPGFNRVDRSEYNAPNRFNGFLLACG
jgi:hypothetical protein